MVKQRVEIFIFRKYQYTIPINYLSYCNLTPSRKARASPPARAPRSPSSWSPAWSRCPPGDPSACSPRTEPQSPAQQTARIWEEQHNILICTVCTRQQCCRSGSVGSICFWESRIRIHSSEIWIRLRSLLSSSKNCKKNIDSYCLVTSLWLFLIDENVPSKSNKRQNLEQNFFVDVLNVTDESNRIRISIRIWIHYSEVWIRGSGSVPKFHGSARLLGTGSSVVFQHVPHR